MTKVNAVQNDNSMLSNVIKGVTIGGVSGYVSKYVMPVTKPEKESKTYKAALGIIKRETNNLKNDVIEKIRNLPDRTLAQDTFLKVVDTDTTSIPEKIINIQGKEAAPDKNMFKAGKKLNIIQKLSPEDKLELRNIISSVNDYAARQYKRHVTAYQVGVTKYIRPGFVGLGAFLGFTAAVAYNVMKTEVQDV